MQDYLYKIAESIGGRSEQQDFAGAINTNYGFLIVVCDGMGGRQGGSTASQMAVDVILHEVRDSASQDSAYILRIAVEKANAAIFKRSQTEEACRGMGTTVAALLISEEKAVIAHVGDSRIYQLRKGKVVYRTFDHSKVFELVKRGIITEEQARLSNDSNVITKALGIQQEVEAEIRDNIPYLKGDRFLLCTDGVCGAIPEEQLVELLDDKSAVDIVAQKIIGAIDQEGRNKGGEHDNLTAALLECSVNSKLKAPFKKDKIFIPLLSLLLILSLAYSIFWKEIDPFIQGSKKKNDSLKSTTISQPKTDSMVKAQPKSVKDSSRRLADSVSEKQQNKLPTASQKTSPLPTEKKSKKSSDSSSSNH